MPVTFEDMQENVPYKWAGNPFVTQQKAFKEDDSYYIKIGKKLIEQRSKRDVALAVQYDKDVFVRVTEL